MDGRLLLRGALVALATLTLLSAARAETLEHVLMPGAVSRAHADTEHDCHACHKLLDRAAQPRLCLDCHDDVAADLDSGRGYHGRLEAAPDGVVCAGCHTEHAGREADIAAFDQAAFEHARTDFPLVGGHADVACRDCHGSARRWRDAPHDCAACHREDDVHQPAFGADCGDCHRPTAWQQARFDHAAVTGYALAGRHAETACTACHARHDYRDTPDTCIACHRDDDEHRGHFGEACGDCHRPQGWDALAFDHDHDTDFALHGKHRGVACGDCHRLPLAQAPPSRCAGCHADDDAHAGHLGDDCAGCHVAAGWGEVDFDHARRTRFALTGAHREPPCKACHGDMKFDRPTPRGCFDCHEDDDSRQGHQGRFGIRCESCHVSATWRRLAFDHGRDTRFALDGAHAAVACTDCHTARLYEDPLERACISCHVDDDVHEGHLGRACGDCHTPARWPQTRFDHETSRFALRGAHREQKCSACHRDDRFRDTPRACAGCHAADDAHGERLGSRCEQCHDSVDWKHGRFDHAARTDFALDGAHAEVACVACHRQPVQGRVVAERRCFACHRGDDVHFATLGERCDACHETRAWRGVSAQAKAWAERGVPPPEATP